MLTAFFPSSKYKLNISLSFPEWHLPVKPAMTSNTFHKRIPDQHLVLDTNFLQVKGVLQHSTKKVACNSRSALISWWQVPEHQGTALLRWQESQKTQAALRGRAVCKDGGVTRWHHLMEMTYVTPLTVNQLCLHLSSMSVDENWCTISTLEDWEKPSKTVTDFLSFSRIPTTLPPPQNSTDWRGQGYLRSDWSGGCSLHINCLLQAGSLSQQQLLLSSCEIYTTFPKILFLSVISVWIQKKNI